MFGCWSQNALKVNLRGSKISKVAGKHAPRPPSFGMLWALLKYAFVIKHHSPFSIGLILMILIQPDHLKTCGTTPGKAVPNGPVGQVLAGPLFLKVKTKFHFAKSK